MSLSEIDKKRIEEVNAILTLPDPKDWNRDIIRRINDLSDNTLISALERGKRLDFGLRIREMNLSQESLDAAGLHLTVRLAKIFIELATHKSRCVEAPPYRDRRRYGTREGEQAIVDEIRELYLEGNSYRSIIEMLNQSGMLPRKGKWNPKTVRAVIENAERGTQRQKCQCRMFRTDWVKPRKWSVCWELLRLGDRIFEAMLAAEGIHYDTSINDIRTFRKARLAPSYSLPPAKQIEARPATVVLNRVVHGDCFELIPQLADDSIAAVITSPPYAQQRNQYDGIPENEYPERMAELMTAIHPKLKENGSVFIVIRSHLENGRVSDYVSRTILAIRDGGWLQTEELMWYKPDGGPLGAIHRPRRNFEHILWFSKKAQPYMDLKACGQLSQRIGLQTLNRHQNIDGTNIPIAGIARVTDVITAYAGSVDRGIEHPAVYPADLVRQLILTYAPPRSLILDPFVGSGTTCLVAQSEDYDFIGFDNGKSITGELYAEMANRRLLTEAKYARGEAKRDRERSQSDANKRARFGWMQMPEPKHRPVEFAVRSIWPAEFPVDFEVLVIRGIFIN